MKVLVELILGHRASVREGKTSEGYTHDWEVYVRSDQGNIQSFVDRVIFHLHESFPKPRRVVKEPPYILRESGYAGFNLIIEILFKNKDDPKNAKFPYDLFLQSQGPPISHSRKEKLIFNFPAEEFAKKLFKGGGVLSDKYEKAQSLGMGNSLIQSHQQVVPAIPAGGKASKHSASSSQSTKLSPKNSFETLFGTPIKRSGGSLVMSTTSTSSSTASTAPTTSAKNLKTAKPDKMTVESNKGGGKGERTLAVKLERPPKHSISPAMQDSPESSKSEYKPSKPKLGKSGPPEKTDKAQSSKKMLPPVATAVPKKAKKSDIFDNSPGSNSSNSVSSPAPAPSKSGKGKGKNSGTSKTKSKVGNSDDSSSSKEKLDAIIKKVKTVAKQPLSPFSSSASSSNVSSPSAVNSEVGESGEELDDSESELLTNKSNNFRNIPLTPSPTPTSSTNRKRLRQSASQSPLTPMSNITSPASVSSFEASCNISSMQPPPSKRRKSSSSSSPVMTPETPPSFRKSHHHNNGNELSNSTTSEHKSKSSSEKKSKKSKSKRSSPSRKSSKKKSGKDKKRSRSPVDSSSTSKSKHKKSKKKKKKSKKSQKVFNDSNSECLSDSSSNSPKSLIESASDSSTPPTPTPSASTNGNNVENNNSGINHVTHTFSHSAVAGSITAEMKLLKDLHARIGTIEDPEKLQEIVDIVVVDSSGKEMWPSDNGVTFDFDLCKLQSTTIKRLQQAILL